jgi:hypothetical protein
VKLAGLFCIDSSSIWHCKRNKAKREVHYAEKCIWGFSCKVSEKILLGKPMYSYEDNIKVYLKQIGWRRKVTGP